MNESSSHCRRFIFCIFTMLLTCGYVGSAATLCKAQNPELINTVERWLKEGHSIMEKGGSTEEIIEFAAKKQLGLPYKSGLLDEPEEETLVVTLESTDCVIYVEMSLALAMTVQQKRVSYKAFKENLKALRYRNRQINGYYSRLHYFSDWLYTNQRKGYLSILFQDKELPELGPIEFMSKNRSQYAKLADSDSLIKLMKQRETYLETRSLYYIPVDKIQRYSENMKTGDVLAFVTNIEGLDVTHTALVDKRKDSVGFYHASINDGVKKSERTIREYVSDQSNVKGIIVARLHPSQAYHNY